MESKRSVQFKEWIYRNMEDIEDAVIPLLVELEQQARIMTHVHTLAGTVDEQAFKKLRAVSDKLREAYGTENETK